MTKIFAGGMGNGHRLQIHSNGCTSVMVICHLHNSLLGEMPIVTQLNGSQKSNSTPFDCCV